jgi:hypothetical protein
MTNFSQWTKQSVTDSSAPDTEQPTASAPHPSEKHYLDQLKDYDHLPPHLQEVAREFYWLGKKMAAELRSGIERCTMLHHIRDAKDAAVRQKVADTKNDTP